MSDNRQDDFSLTVDAQDGPATSDQVARVGAVRGAAALKSLWAPENRKRLVFMGFAGTLLIGGLAYSAMSVDEESVSRASVGLTQSGKPRTDANDQTTDLQRQAALAYNEEKLPEVQKENPSAHPIIPLDSPPPFVPARELVAPRKVSATGETAPAVTNTRAVTPTPVAPPAQRDQELDQLIKNLIADEAAVPKQLSVSWDYPSKKTAQTDQQNAAANSVAQVGIETRSQPKACEWLVRAGSMLMGTTDIALNSDVGGPASVTIRNGALRNFKLIGTFERKEEWVRLEFRRLVGPEKTYNNVQAVGLDVVTTLNAVEGDVNRHLVYRYGWWGVGSLLKAVGSAAEANSNQSVIVADGVAVQSTTQDSAREVKMALGSLGDDLGSAFQDRLNRPITVSLNVGDEVGIYFIDDVCR